MPQHLRLLLGLLPAGAALLGVPPQDEAKYGGKTFSCFKGGVALPAAVINDGYCDCDDGSDEPGTGACAGQETTLFYCLNEGSIPRRLYASRVGDGICDCCDGSDEADLAKRKPRKTSWFGGSGDGCSNTCIEEGKKQQELRAKRTQMLKDGLAKADQSRQDAVVKRTERQAEIEKLKQELPALEKEQAEATRLADVEREEKKKKEEAEKAAKDAAEAAKCGKVPLCMWRQTGGCKPDGERESAFDKACNATIPRGTSGFCDCDGNGVKDEGEKGYECSDPSRTNCCNACSAQKAEAPAAGQEPAAAGEKKEEKQVSEYAKWMDGAEEELGKDDLDDEEPQVSEYAKWMDGAEAELSKEKKTEATEAKSESAEVPSDKAEAAPSAIDKEKEIKDKVRANKDQTSSLQKKIDALPDDYLGYAGLEGVTISKQVGEHNYKVTFFDEAKQGHISLGRWDKFDGTGGGFKKGTRCWDGPERELQVSFLCGSEAELLDVTEPSKCVYKAVIAAPGACDAAELERMEKETPIFGPRDEL